MSEQQNNDLMAASIPLTIVDLARLQGATEVRGLDDLATDIWESDDELDLFLADLRSSRSASLG